MDATLLAALVAEYRLDAGAGDRTTTALGLAGQSATGTIVARSPCVAAGTALAAALPQALALNLSADIAADDGASLTAGDVLATLHGDAADLLAVERTLLNALQLLCGIAAETRRWVAALPDAFRLLDTRKTHPGLRGLERLAVRAGGGYNHRFNLTDAIIVKDNHIALIGSTVTAVSRAVAATAPGLRVQCEVESLEDAVAAVAAGAGALLIDNQPVERWPDYWNTLAPNIELEFSGGIRFETLATLPQPPRPIWISSSQTVLGAAPADIGLDIESS